MKTCTIADCVRPQRKRTWCATHYARWFRTGSPTGSTAVPFDVEANFWRRVEKSDGCWEWKGYRMPFGHGILWTNHRATPAHRYAWALLVGPIPEGKAVLHHCDNPPCVRPDHLFIGTRADNIADMTRKGRRRQSDSRGSRNSQAKLSEREVIAIRAARDAGSSLKNLADQYRVTPELISKIGKRQIWRHI